MATTIAASETGLAQVDVARRKKQWNKHEQAWCDLAITAQATLKRFWAKKPIDTDTFERICQTVGIEDWQTIADLTVRLSAHVEALYPSPFPPPLHFSTYKPQTWAGRSPDIAALTATLTEGCRLLVVHGLTGIGKTTLVEKLAADLVGSMRYVPVMVDREVGATDFTRGAIGILAKMGDETAQTLPDDQILPHLLNTLKQAPCWLQLDSLEYLLCQTPEGTSQFIDRAWADFLCDFLTANTASRIVITSQALPANLLEQCDRYGNRWHSHSLRGLEKPAWLDLFRTYGVVPQTPTDATHLCTIAEYFDGHPLILKMIAGDIGKPLFGGSATKYWHDYYSQQTRPKLHQSEEQRARHWVNQTLTQLPNLPHQMLQRGAVFRRAVPEGFYLAMLEDTADPERQAALQTLKSRYLVEDDDIQAGQIFIRQHNLIRECAAAQLAHHRPTWETAARQAAHLWLTAYTPPTNAPNLETVRGYLEAFDHYCEIEDWELASEMYTFQLAGTDQALHWQLIIWGYYQELIAVSRQLVNNINSQTRRLCLNQIGNSYNYLGNYGRAIDFHQQALVISREIGDRRGEGNALGNLGIAYNSLGQYERAIDFLQQYLTIALEIGDRRGEGNALGNLGNAYFSLGQYERAIDFHQQNLTIAREIGDRGGEGAALGNLGIAYNSLGQYERAIDFYQQNLTITREIGDRGGEGAALVNMGATQLKLKQYPESLTHNQAALEIFREIGFRAGVAEALKNLAELHHALGEVEVARQFCQQALALATELGIPLKAECEALQLKLQN